MSDRSFSSWLAATRTRVRRAFTMVEVVVVVVIIGVLAALVVPRFGGVTEDAKTAALQGALGGVRASLAGFRTSALLAGNPPYPTLQQLTTAGLVSQNTIPENPFNKLATVQAVSANEAANRVVKNTSQYGWNYYVDNAATPPAAIFYANTPDDTTITTSGGATRKANEL